MIRECPRCGSAIPADVTTRYELRECPQCRFVATSEATTRDENESESESGTRAHADGGCVVADQGEEASQ